MGSIKQEMRTISIRVDLITGFLGAGKTTFLLRFARYLMARGQRIGILVYDHGAMNVDLPMLNELRGERQVVAQCDTLQAQIGTILNPAVAET